MPYWSHDGLEFRYRTAGAGLPVALQHGLGSDANAPMMLFPPPPGVRTLAFDFRGHGLTRPLGPEEKLTLRTLCDDWLAWLDHMSVGRAVLGGISLGSAAAVDVALRFPERVLALILILPAWRHPLTERNGDYFRQVAQLIRAHGPTAGQRAFEQTSEYREVAAVSADGAAALLGQFQHHRAEETVAKLERLPVDPPVQSLDALRAVRVPTLVLSSRQDVIHPWAFAEAICAELPSAELFELPPRSADVERFAQMLRERTAQFLRKHGLASTPGVE